MGYSEYRVGDKISIDAKVTGIESLHGGKEDILTVALTGECKEVEVCGGNPSIHLISRPKTGGQVLFETHFTDFGDGEGGAFGGWEAQEPDIRDRWEITARRLGITGDTEVKS
jgi:hypothetical protein